MRPSASVEYRHSGRVAFVLLKECGHMRKRSDLSNLSASWGCSYLSRLDFNTRSDRAFSLRWLQKLLQQYCQQFQCPEIYVGSSWTGTSHAQVLSHSGSRCKTLGHLVSLPTVVYVVQIIRIRSKKRNVPVSIQRWGNRENIHKRRTKHRKKKCPLASLEFPCQCN